MTGITYPHVDDYDRLQAIRERIQIERLADVGSNGGYVLHNSTWWRVAGPDSLEGIGLEIAGPSDAQSPQTSVLIGDPDDLIVYAGKGRGLQFRDGTLLDVIWPDFGLIYVKEAYRLGVGNDPDEVVRGIFSLVFNPYGDAYYTPTNPKTQPGVAPTCLLFQDRDLILDWRPVDVGDLRSRMETEDAAV
mgnify:FL=1